MRFVLALLLLSAQPAHALSCLRPSVQASFAAAHGSPLRYVMARGTLTALADEAAPASVPARFRGAFATLSGFDRAADVPVTVELGCAGPWCAQVPGGEVIAFLQLRDGGYVLTEGPCPFYALAATAESEAAALACLRGEACVAR